MGLEPAALFSAPNLTGEYRSTCPAQNGSCESGAWPRDHGNVTATDQARLVAVVANRNTPQKHSGGTGGLARKSIWIFDKRSPATGKQKLIRRDSGDDGPLSSPRRRVILGFSMKALVIPELDIWRAASHRRD